MHLQGSCHFVYKVKSFLLGGVGVGVGVIV